MEERFSRTAALIGEDGLKKLNEAKVLLLGAGGVGGYVAESLIRSGIGNLTIVDGDTVAPSNFNRQIVATESSLYLPKAEVAARRAISINPEAVVTPIVGFWTAEDVKNADLISYDYVIDAIDTVTTKLALIRDCLALGVKIISCMGTGNKLQPEKMRVARLKDTVNCPLCKVMRRELRDEPSAGNVKVVFSPEIPVVRRRPPASMVFCPAVAGLLTANEVVKDIIG